MSLEKQLKGLGLDTKEAKLYLSLLELGISSVSEISDKAGVNRITSYRIIERLKKRGLVSQLSRNKKTVFIAEDVSKFKEELDYRFNILEDIIPQLNAIAGVVPTKPKVRYYEGEDNVKKLAFEAISTKGSKVYMWSTYDVIPFYGEDVQRRYTDLRIQNKVYIYVITHRCPLAEEHKHRGSKELREVRFYKNTKYQFNIDIYLHSNKFITFNNYTDLVSLVVESRELYLMMKTIFEMNWEQLDP